MPYPTVPAAGAQLPSSDLADLVFNPAYTYGETISGAGIPLYQKASDGKLWKADADVLESITNFVGFSIEAGNADTTHRVFGPGKIATGFSSLTPGTLYYLANAVGTIGTARGTYYLEVGVAVSTTTLLIKSSTLAPDVNKFGDGSDGACVLDGTNTYATLMSKVSSVYTLIRDVYLTNLSLSAGVTLKTAGYRIYGTGTATGPGTIDCSGGAGANANSGTPGAAGVAQGAGTLGGGTNGGIGVGITGEKNGTVGVNVANSIGSIAGNGGNAGGGTGGTAGTVTASKMSPRTKADMDDSMIETGATIISFKAGSGGGSGAISVGGNQGSSGGGGAGAGILFLAFYILAANLIVWAKGGNAGTPAASGSYDVGGSGGGGGGWIQARYHIDLGATFSVVGGTHSDGIASGATGTDGTAGTIFKVQV